MPSFGGVEGGEGSGCDDGPGRESGRRRFCWCEMGKGTAKLLRRACRNILRDPSAALALNLACFDWTR